MSIVLLTLIQKLKGEKMKTKTKIKWKKFLRHM